MENDLPQAEPYKIKVVEPIRLIPREQRERRIVECDYNMFRLTRDEIYIDLLTDSGTSAMSENQWAGIMLGDESYAGGRNYTNLKAAVEKVLGFDLFVPVHQGRPAEHVLFKALVKEGDFIPFNMPFDTTIVSVMANGGTPVSCVVDEAYEPGKIADFKGNLDLDKLAETIDQKGADRIPFVMVTITNNPGGGQPVSMRNLREVKQLAGKHGIPVYLDAARCVENAYFIQQREEGYRDKSIAEILLEEFSYSDGCTFSCKKDALVNMGGLVCVRDKELYERLIPILIQYEGFFTYGGMSGRDEEALARGLAEMADDAYIANRVKQVEYLGRRVSGYGIPVIQPIGGHAVFVDALAFFPHIPQAQFPAEVLNAELYRECGVRGVGLGALAFRRVDEKTGEVFYPKLEHFRLAIPRRVYTDRHMDVVAEGLKRVYERREKLEGLKIKYAPDVLAHFTAQLEPVS